MNNEQLIEYIKNQNHKLENDLRVKVENEKHLIYENEVLFAENQKLLQMTSQDKETTLKLQNKIEKLKGDLDELNVFKDENEELVKLNEQLKSDLDKQLKLNKQLQKPVVKNFESPSDKLREIEQGYKLKIQELTETIRLLEIKSDTFQNQINKMKMTTEKEINELKASVDMYKEFLDEARKEKEEIQYDLLEVRNEMSRPDFNRQGNSMYQEVDDRRIQAEKIVINYQKELIRLRDSNRSLRLFLEKSFLAYSEMKDEEFQEMRRDLLEKNAYLTRVNNSLQSANTELNNQVKKLTDTRSNDGVTQALRMQLRIMETGKKDVEKELATVNEYLEKMKQKRNNTYKEFEKASKENSGLKAQMEKMEMKLEWVSQIIPVEKQDEFEREWQEQMGRNEQAKVEMERNRESIPTQVFGPYYQQAQNSNTLVFDQLGNIIPNKLTKRVLGIDKVEEKINNIEPVKIEIIDQKKANMKSFDLKEIGNRLKEDEKNGRNKENVKQEPKNSINTDEEKGKSNKENLIQNKEMVTNVIDIESSDVADCSLM